MKGQIIFIDIIEEKCLPPVFLIVAKYHQQEFQTFEHKEPKTIKLFSILLLFKDIFSSDVLISASRGRSQGPG